MDGRLTCCFGERKFKKEGLSCLFARGGLNLKEVFCIPIDFFLSKRSKYVCGNVAEYKTERMIFQTTKKLIDESIFCRL